MEGRRKVKFTTTETPTEETRPAASFCDACKAKDTRLLQDRVNRLFISMQRVADAIQIEFNGINWDKGGLMAIDDWAEAILKERRKAMERRMAGRPVNDNVEKKHTKYDKGIDG